MAEKLATLLTTEEAAEYLGVTVERILYWARDGLLRVAAQTEAGDLLFRRHVLDTTGENLAVLAPVRRPRKRRLPACERSRVVLPCGCCPSRSFFHLCHTGAGLLAALQLAEGFAAVAPDDPLLRRLAGICREALTTHLMPGAGATTALVSRHNTSKRSSSEPEDAAAEHVEPVGLRLTVAGDTPVDMTSR